MRLVVQELPLRHPAPCRRHHSGDGAPAPEVLPRLKENRL